MKSRFQPDSNRNLPQAGEPTDLEGYDASEQLFSASLEEKEETPARPRFSLEEVADVEVAQETTAEAAASASIPADLEAAAIISETTDQALPADPGTWKQEVAARVNSYRSRRRVREPRYPSLLLKFEANNEESETPLAISENASYEPTTATPVQVHAVAMDPMRIAEPSATEIGGRVLEFPRSLSSVAPPRPLDELAEPVADRPRILEVPEVAPPPPALGGILIEPARVEERERRPGFELPLQAAPLARRLAASGVDLALTLCAVVEFAYVFYRITRWVPPVPQAAAMVLAAGCGLWAVYQYTFLVYSGATPGLWVARLRLSRFDGVAVSRSARRWRALASLLSAASLGLGYAWCLMDEDQLCWHDRITHTYMAPKPIPTRPPE